MAVWVCLNQGHQNMVLVVLLQIEASNLTVQCQGCSTNTFVIS